MFCAINDKTDLRDIMIYPSYFIERCIRRRFGGLYSNAELLSRYRSTTKISISLTSKLILNPAWKEAELFKQ